MMLATFDHSQFDLRSLLDLKRERVSVCIPTRETAETIRATVAAVAELRERGLVDQIVVIDAGSEDGTAAIARGAGAEAFDEAELLADFGPPAGKGDAMWRALSVLDGEIVVYLDGDVRDFGAHYVLGLLGPLLQSEGIDFVKGFYRRPLTIDSIEVEDGGGRVTELTAKPLLELFLPELAAFHQPLAGECAARRSLLEETPYVTGYGVEIAMLVEVWRRVGLERMAQVKLGCKRNAHQPLAQLGEMSREVIEALLERVTPDAVPASPWEGRRRLETRPPMRRLSSRPAAGTPACRGSD
jgi:glucosyl-3-phosphoglycerate synthase